MTTSPLTCAISTTPAPLGVSAEGHQDPETGRLHILVSNLDKKKITCRRIVLTLRVGPGAADLTRDPADIVYSAAPSRAWRLDRSGGIITALPKNAQAVEIEAGKAIRFELSGIAVNSAVGVTPVKIETWTSGEAPDDPQSFDVQKYPAGFHFGDFHCTKLDGVTPTSRVALGTPVKLTWTGSQEATYTLLYDNKSVDVTHVRSWPPDDSLKLSRDTTFYLKATVGEGENLVSHYLAATVELEKPNLSATKVTADEINTEKFTSTGTNFKVDSKGALSLADDNFWVASDGHFAAAKSKIHGFNDGGFNAVGPIRITSSSEAKLKNPKWKFRVDSDGKVAAQGLELQSGVFTLNGTAQLFGRQVREICTFEVVQNKRYKKSTRINGKDFKTDGLILGSVHYKGGDFSSGLIFISGQQNELTAGATLTGNPYHNPGASSFLMPVRSGMELDLGAESAATSAVSWVAHFYWIPFGAA